MNYKKRYIAIDSQGGEFGENRLYTLKEWKEQAIDWANLDDLAELVKDLKKQPLKEIINYISEIWGLEFRQVKINKWCWDDKTNELVLYNTQNNKLKELFVIKYFTEYDYKQLPKNDNDCLDKIIDRLNKDWQCWYSTDNKVETEIYYDNWEN